jgi:UPF0716 protein FxsA
LEFVSLRLSFLPFLFLAVPLSEIAVFVFVGSRIGVGWTIALVITTAVIGSMLLRYQGLGALVRVQSALREGRMPGKDLVHGVMVLLAGFLLLTPGFITDTLGFLLFIPPLREWLFGVLKRHLVFVDLGGVAGPQSTRGGPRTIDLESDDWRADDN